MKKRLLSLVLATSMLFGSVNVAFANETSTPVEITNEVSETVDTPEVVDAVASGDSVEENTETTTTEISTTESTGINWSTTSPWLATVYGDAAGQAKIDNYGNPDFAEYKKYSGVTVYPYDVVENGNEVNIRMGNPNIPDGETKPESVGKISGSTDGRTVYYRQLTADDDFTISAVAHINGLDYNNQVSFGAMVSDNITPLVNSGDTAADSVNAGIRQIKNANDASDITKMAFGWTRNNGTITDYNPADNTTLTVPKAGDDIKISLKKSGTTYTIKFGDQSTTIDGSELAMTDDIFVGLYAVRCADVTFKNVTMSVVGEMVDISDKWETNGNGLNGDDDQVKYTKFTGDNENFTLTIDDKDVGKFSSSEDSYSYRAAKAPVGEDFAVNATIDSININPSSTPKQAAAGFMVFDEHYTKNANAAGDPTASYTNSFFVGLLSTDGNSGSLVARVRKGDAVETTTLLSAGVNEVGTPSGPFNIVIKKSGDIIKVKINDNEAVDFDVTGLFENNEYIGYTVARQGSITVSNNKIEVGTKKVTNLEVVTLPTKLAYYSTQKFDTTGLVLNATYADGTSEVISNADDYSLTGFDDASRRYFTTPGERTVVVSIGKATTEIPVNVRPMNVTNINIDYAPVYDTFYEGGKLNTTGLQVTAKFEDGSSKKLSSSEYVLTIGDTVVVPGTTTLTADMAGVDVAVNVKYTGEDETINPGNESDAFYIQITPGKLTGIKIYTRDYKTTYYLGDELDTTGLSVYGVYVDSNGNQSYQYISADHYEVIGFDSTKTTDSLTLTVQYKEDPSLYDTYEIKVLEAAPIKVDILSYPRLTYTVGETFDTNGLDFTVLYTDNTNLSLCSDAYFFKNGIEYYKIYNTNVVEDGVAHTVGERVELSEAEVLDADFYVDLTNYDSSSAGITNITFIVNDRFVAAADEIVWDITIEESKDYIWKATLFGASCMGASGSSDAISSYVDVTYNDNTSARTNDTSYGVKPELMENGTLNNVKDVDIVSWTGSGKISGDQDGIAYYYTKVNGQKNFTMSADITVNRYIADPSTLSGVQKATYESYIAAGDSSDVALDKLRSGQEAFGIMARDIVPFAGGIDAEGNYRGGATNHMTPLADEAATKEYEFKKADGSTVTYSTPVDLLEAYLNNITVTDATGYNYRVSKANVEAQIASNVVIAGGCSDSTWPTDPNSSSYSKKTLMNRINIMTRRGVAATNGGGERVGIYSTTNKLPEAGEKYNITLTKMNTGYMITTYDYQTGDTVTKYSFETEDDTENVLENQDAENIYVGFFASRYADCTVENIQLHETDPATDPNITATVNEAVSPKVTVSSPYYTTATKYVLRMKSNSTAGMTGGVTSISLNGKTIKNDIILGNKISTYQVDLVPDTINQFSVVYYPNTADNFISYDPVITRFTVTHKSISDTSKLYIGPNGSVNGDGSRDNPLNLETALGIVGFGGEVIALDGIYNVTNTDLGKIEIPDTYSGYGDGNFKTLRAEEGANPIIDLEKKYTGFEVDADYWLFKGLTVINSQDNEKAFSLGGMHCVVEDCTFYDNGTTGLQISRINSSDATIYTWPSYNVIKSCESFNNCDPSKNNADGFAAKLTVGYGNVFEDCISHHNLDDGWDCYTKISTGAIGAVVLENCISYRQGYQLNEDGTDSDFDATSGGNGYKLGGEGIYVEHMLKDSITFNNKASGIDSNNNPALKVRNVIAFNNYGKNFSLYSNTADSLSDASGSEKDAEGKVYKFNYDLKGAVSVGRYDEIGSWNSETDYANVSINPIDNESNYLIKSNSDLTPVNSEGVKLNTTEFFKSINPVDSYGNNKRYERAEDGSFIHGDFLARTEEYVHDAADIVTLPDVYGGNGGVGVDTGEATEATTTEVTTTANRGSSGAGGGGSTKNYVTTTTTTETTTTTNVDEDVTETTTEAPVLTASVAVKVSDKNITIDDKNYTMDVAPYIQVSSNSTMVPLRFVAIALAGGNVDSADSSDIITWDAVAKTATIKAGSNTIVFTANSRTYTVNGNEFNISNQAIAEIVDGRMFVPFRTIGEALGVDVSWDANTKTAMYN